MTVAESTIRAARSSERTIPWARVHLDLQWSLAGQYRATSLLVVLTDVLVTGAWIGHQIQFSMLDRTDGITALYIESVLDAPGSSLQRNATRPERRHTRRRTV